MLKRREFFPMLKQMYRLFIFRLIYYTNSCCSIMYLCSRASADWIQTTPCKGQMFITTQYQCKIPPRPIILLNASCDIRFVCFESVPVAGICSERSTPAQRAERRYPGEIVFISQWQALVYGCLCLMALVDWRNIPRRKWYRFSLVFIISWMPMPSDK